MPKYYFAITIGPLVKTISQAQSTRELWASSYVFSLLMREFIKAADAAKLGTLISPSYDGNPPMHGAGVYPDRAFWELPNAEKPDFKAIAEDAIAKTIGVAKISKKEEFKKYFNIKPVYMEFGGGGKSPLDELNAALDALELDSPLKNSSYDIVKDLESNIQDLYKDGHLKGSNRNKNIFIYDGSISNDFKRLPSLTEIATIDLATNHKAAYDTNILEPTNKKIRDFIKGIRSGQEIEEEEELLLKDLKDALKDSFKFRHKYVCFVNADGDNVGSIIGKIGDDTVKIKEFSRLLGKFANDGVAEIVEYGGVPIYAGGDDLLFVAPIFNKEKSIFDLFSEIDKKLPATELSALVNNEVTPSMSYGLSISYYKYPMSESLDIASEALFEKAKKFEDKAGKKVKNTVAFQLQKHSGQQVGCCISKHGTAYTKWKELIQKSVMVDDEVFLTSVMHKVNGLKTLFEDAIENDSLVHFFKNQFNEKDHKDKFNAYLENVRTLAEELFKENQDAKLTTTQIFAMLRFVQFINQADHA